LAKFSCSGFLIISADHKNEIEIEIENEIQIEVETEINLLILKLKMLSNKNSQTFSTRNNEVVFS
jgi:hypothetical protein